MRDKQRERESERERVRETLRASSKILERAYRALRGFQTKPSRVVRFQLQMSLCIK